MALTNAERQALWRLRQALLHTDLLFDYFHEPLDDAFYVRYLDRALHYHLITRASDGQMHLL